MFEDIGTQVYKGQVLKPLERANPVRHNNDPLPGRIRYRAPDHSEVEVPFGDKDQVKPYTSSDCHPLLTALFHHSEGRFHSSSRRLGAVSAGYRPA